MIFGIKLNNQTPFWILTIAIVFVLTLPVLIQDGMFMDAMLYTSVSHNLGNGIGTFWFPSFSYHELWGLKSFHEQPPLVFGIQSLFFKYLGSSMYVERFYTFLTLIITIFLINYLWKEIFKSRPELKSHGWIAIFLWITIPVCFWSYSNNMHENTMGIFTLSSVILIYKALETKKYRILRLIAGGLFIVLSVLSKGFPGFFPLGIPALYWVCTRKSNIKEAFVQTFILLFTVGGLIAILFAIPESNKSLSTYLFDRALNRITSDPNVGSRFYILYKLFAETAFQIIITVVLLLIGKSKKIANGFPENLRTGIFFLAVGFSASVPMMLTLVQKAFYFVPALPFFGIGLAILLAPTVAHLIKKITIETKTYKILNIISIVLLFSVLGFTASKYGKYGRDEDLLKDVYIIGEVVPEHTLVSSPEGVDHWSLQCYLSRSFYISVENSLHQKYCIVSKSGNVEVPDYYEKCNLETKVFDLYVLIEKKEAILK